MTKTIGTECSKLIEIKDAGVRHGDAWAVRGADLTLCRGEHMLLYGPNGSGKSTVLGLMNGELRPYGSAGTVIWYRGGIGDTSPLNGRQMCATVSPRLQDYYTRQAWRINGEEVVLAASSDDYILYRKPEPEERQAVRSLADAFGAVSLLERQITTFSRGEMRKVLILRALYAGKPVLLLDEVLCGLDEQSRDIVLDMLEKLAARRDAPTMVMVKHRLPVPGFIRKAVRMEGGRISSVTTAPHGAASGQAFVSGISDCVSFYRMADDDSSTADEVGEHTRESIEKYADIPEFLLDTPRGIDICVANASVYIDHNEIVHGADLHIKAGESWAILGGNGAGKSTFLLALLGAYPVAAGGSIKRCYAESPDERLVLLEEIERAVGYVSDALQTGYTYDDTVRDVLIAGIRGHVGIWSGPTAEEVKKAEAMERFLGLGRLSHRPIRSLSSGQARLLLLGRALMPVPRIVLLDEPYSGLDPSARSFMAGLLAALRRRGMQTVLVTHYEEDIPQDMSHVAEMKKGILTVLR